MSWIILANAKKRKARVVMTVLGIAIGVATLFALLSLSAGIEKALDREISGMGAHILLLPEGCPYELTLSLMQGSDAFEHIPANVLPEIQAVDNVDLAVPVAVGKAKVPVDLDLRHHAGHSARAPMGDRHTRRCRDRKRCR